MTKTNRSIRLGVLLWFRLSRFYNNSNRKSNQHLKEYGLNVAQLDLLAQIGHNKSISQQELADKLLVTKGNITQLLKKMEEQNLIERKQEWKTKFVSLTEKGLKLYSEVIPKQETFQAAQFDSLTEAEKKQFLNLLKKIQK